MSKENVNGSKNKILLISSFLGFVFLLVQLISIIHFFIKVPFDFSFLNILLNIFSLIFLFIAIIFNIVGWIKNSSKKIIFAISFYLISLIFLFIPEIFFTLYFFSPVIEILYVFFEILVFVFFIPLFVSPVFVCLIYFVFVGINKYKNSKPKNDYIQMKNNLDVSRNNSLKYIIGSFSAVLCILFFVLPLISYNVWGRRGSYIGLEIIGDYPVACLLIILPAILAIMAFLRLHIILLSCMSFLGLAAKIVFIAVANNEMDRRYQSLTASSYIILSLYIVLFILSIIGIIYERTGKTSNGSFPNYKKCPYCANDIKFEAIVCQYCHKDLPKE